MRCVKVVLALDVEFAIGTTLELECDNDARIFANHVSDDREIRSQRLHCFDKAVSSKAYKQPRSDNLASQFDLKCSDTST